MESLEDDPAGIIKGAQEFSVIDHLGMVVCEPLNDRLSLIIGLQCLIELACFFQHHAFVVEALSEFLLIPHDSRVRFFQFFAQAARLLVGLERSHVFAGDMLEATEIVVGRGKFVFIFGILRVCGY